MPSKEEAELWKKQLVENAEKKITILLEKNGDFEEKPFDTNNE